MASSAALLETVQAVFVDGAARNSVALSRAALGAVGSGFGISGVLSGNGGTSAGLGGVLDGILAELLTGYGSAFNVSASAALEGALGGAFNLSDTFPPACCQQRAAPGLPSLARKAASIVSPYTDPAQSLNGYEDTASNGPAYYLASLYGLPLVSSSDANALYVWTGREGAAYSGGRLCLTSTCLKNTITFLNVAPIQSLAGACGIKGGGVGLLARAHWG